MNTNTPANAVANLSKSNETNQKWAGPYLLVVAMIACLFSASVAFAEKQILFETFFDNTDNMTLSMSPNRPYNFIGLSSDPHAPRIRRTRPPILQDGDPPYLVMSPAKSLASVEFEINVENKSEIEIQVSLAASRIGNQFGALDFQNYFKEGEFFRTKVNGQLLPEGLYVGGNPHNLSKWFRRFSALTNPDTASDVIPTNFDSFTYQIPASLVPAGTQTLTVQFECKAGFRKVCAMAYFAALGNGACGVDMDEDGTPDCSDQCPNDAAKTEPLVCGCGNAETDTDNDGTPDCVDLCPEDPSKTDPGSCGCGVGDVDTDGDGTLDCDEECTEDPNKLDPGECGCGVADTDTDGDTEADCNDDCPNDPNKIGEGVCGCGVADTDTDGDGTPDCNDQCPSDINKDMPGICGCGSPDVDTDGDATFDCDDACPEDADKIELGQCGCGTPDTDSDGDGTANCVDFCSADPNKTEALECGCGNAETGDTDGDGTHDCNEDCDNDASKTAPGICGCGTADTDTDGDGTADCNDDCPSDNQKTAAGVCGCGEVESGDTDGDGTLDCVDACPDDPAKDTSPGLCGCDEPEPSDPGGNEHCLNNADFANGLTHWDVLGDVVGEDSMAKLTAQSTATLMQDFLAPAEPYSLSFSLGHIPANGTVTVELQLAGQAAVTIASYGEADSPASGFMTKVIVVPVEFQSDPQGTPLTPTLIIKYYGDSGTTVDIDNFVVEEDADKDECLLADRNPIGGKYDSSRPVDAWQAVGGVGNIGQPGIAFTTDGLTSMKQAAFVATAFGTCATFENYDYSKYMWNIYFYRKADFLNKLGPTYLLQDLGSGENLTFNNCPASGDCFPDQAQFGTTNWQGGLATYLIKFNLQGLLPDPFPAGEWTMMVSSGHQNCTYGETLIGAPDLQSAPVAWHVTGNTDPIIYDIAGVNVAISLTESVLPSQSGGRMCCAGNEPACS